MNVASSVVLLIGILAGILVGITGTSGAFLIPLMTLLFRETQVRAQGTALLIGALPTWSYSSGWGYYPSGGLGLILLIVLILALWDESECSKS